MANNAFKVWEDPDTATKAPKDDAFLKANKLLYSIKENLKFSYFAYLVRVKSRKADKLEFVFIDCDTKKDRPLPTADLPAGATGFTLDLSQWGVVHPELPSTLPDDDAEAAQKPISLLLLNTASPHIDPIIAREAKLTNADEPGQGKWPRLADLSGPEDRARIEFLQSQLTKASRDTEVLRGRIAELESENARLRPL